MKLTVPPFAGYLQAWGRRDEAWWAVVAWDEQAIDYRQRDQRRTAIFCSAWVAGQHVRPWQGATNAAVPKIRLPSDRRMWPAARRPGQDPDPVDFYFGALDGRRIQAPPGVIWLGPPPVTASSASALNR